MSKPSIKQSTYYKAGIVLGIGMAGVSALCTYVLINNAVKTILVPVANPQNPEGILRKGDIITPQDITLTEVGAFNFPTNIVVDPSHLNDMYANRDIRKGEFFYSNTLTTDYQKTLAEKVRYGAVSVPIDLISSVNADIKEDDFVTVKIIMGSDKQDDTNYSNVDLEGKLPDAGITIIDDEALAAVRVVGFYESTGADVTKKKEANSNISYEEGAKELSVSPRMIVFDANPIQQALLLQGAYGGQIQLVILPESEQIKHKKAWGLIDNDGNLVKNPVFEDNTLDIKKDSEQLKEDAKALQMKEEELIAKINERAVEHAKECQDPFTCKDPIHYNHICPEDKECTHPIHHVLECSVVDCKDPAHDKVVLQ